MIIIAKIGKWLAVKGLNIASTLAVLFLIFLLVTVFAPKVKKAFKDVLDKDSTMSALNNSIAKNNQEISAIQSKINSNQSRLEFGRLEEGSLVKQIQEKVKGLKKSAKEDFDSRCEKANEELKVLEDETPWFYVLNWRERTSHFVKIKAQKVVIAGLKMASSALEQDDPLVKKHRLILQENEITAANLKAANSSLGLLHSKQKQLDFQLSKLTGNVTTTEEVVRAWRKFQPWIFWAVGCIVLTPIVWSVFMFYVIAPLATKQRPIKLVETDVTDTCWSTPKASLNVELAPSDKLWVRNELLTQRDGSTKRTAFLWNWRAPAVSTLSGLLFCTKVVNDSDQSSKFALSSNAPEEEISAIILENDSAVILHVANIVAIAGDVTVTARWRIWNLNGWLTGQLRFLVFKGPGRIFVGGPRGIEGCKVTDQELVEQPVTIGFDGCLEYSVKRTETFIPYLRGQASLFDDCFEGQGTMFRKNAASHGRKNFLERTFGTFFAILGKLFGF